jgi:hypothetical protein
MEPRHMSTYTNRQTKAREKPWDSVRSAVPSWDLVILRARRRHRVRDHELEQLLMAGSVADIPKAFPSKRSTNIQLLHLVCPDSGVLMGAIKLGFDTPYSVEVMLNLITQDPYELRDDFRDHMTLKHNRGNHVIKGEVDYFHQWQAGKRAPSRILVMYPDRVCKDTGKACLHIEDRVTGLTNIRNRLGFDTVEGMLEFDHVSYWKERLGFARPDLERLGRQSLKRKGQHRRITKANSETLTAIGQVIRNQYASLQHLIQERGRDCLVKFEVDLKEVLTRDLDMEELLEQNGLKMHYVEGVRSDYE